MRIYTATSSKRRKNCCTNKISSQKQPRLKFGKKLSSITPPDALPPKLYHLLLYLYINAPYVHQLFPLTPIHQAEKEELKKALKSNEKICMCQYSESTAFAVLRNFLRHLPNPLLDSNQWNLVAEQLCKEENESLIIEEFKEVISRLTPQEQLLLKHLLLVIYKTASDPIEGILNPLKLNELIQFLGCSILRKPNVKIPVDAQPSPEYRRLLEFLVKNMAEIFGDCIWHQFPERETIQQPNTYDRSQLFDPWSAYGPFGLFGGVSRWIASPLVSSTTLVGFWDLGLNDD